MSSDEMFYRITSLLTLYPLSPPPNLALNHTHHTPHLSIHPFRLAGSPPLPPAALLGLLLVPAGRLYFRGSERSGEGLVSDRHYGRWGDEGCGLEGKGRPRMRATE